MGVNECAAPKENECVAGFQVKVEVGIRNINVCVCVYV